MPYITLKDRSGLDPLIEKLREKVLDFPEGTAVSISMRYIAERVLIEGSLNAAEQYQGKRATRYWLLVNHAGIALNIAFELWDRVFSKVDPASLQWFEALFVPLDPIPSHDVSQILGSDVDALIAKIKKLAGPFGYNYDCAYCGLVNYAMTELMPRIMMDACDSGGDDFVAEDVEDMMFFWFGLARTLYTEIARPYEDEQIAKNSDVSVYNLLLRRLNV